MIRIVSVALPKSPTNLAQGDEVRQIITRITRQRPSEILHILQNDFCNTIGPKPTCRVLIEAAIVAARRSVAGKASKRYPVHMPIVVRSALGKRSYFLARHVQD